MTTTAEWQCFPGKHEAATETTKTFDSAKSLPEPIPGAFLWPNLNWEQKSWGATEDIRPAGCVVILWVEARRGFQLAAHEGRAAVVVGRPTSQCPGRRIPILASTYGHKVYIFIYTHKKCEPNWTRPQITRWKMIQIIGLLMPWPWSWLCFRLGLSLSLLCETMEPVSVSLSKLSRPLAAFPLQREIWQLWFYSQ